jgi:hypothetical protein
LLDLRGIRAAVATGVFGQLLRPEVLRAAAAAGVVESSCVHRRCLSVPIQRNLRDPKEICGADWSG